MMARVSRAGTRDNHQVQALCDRAGMLSDRGRPLNAGLIAVRHWIRPVFGRS